MSSDSASSGTSSNNSHLTERKYVDFPISPELLQGILDHGYTHATPIQAAAIEPALAGRDLLARAKTGTGKTAAFAIPIIELVGKDKKKPQALILAPTRELAQQIAEEIDALTTHQPISTAVLVGGLPMPPQERKLANGAAIVVGTPGRVLDHWRRKNLDLSDCRMACLDEADEMVSMGFYEDVTKILSKTPDGRQVLLFSATISPDTERLVRKFLKDPEHIILSTDEDKVEGITHITYEAPSGIPKQRALMYVIDSEDPDAAIIFCNTRQDTNSVGAYLERQGMDVVLISGELPQTKRTAVMKRVKAGEVRFLVATDVAARGIDISDLTHVFNYNLPQDAKVYLHRIGRTGRAGRDGRAVSLISGTDMGTRRVLEKVHAIDFIEKPFPDEIEAVRKRVDRQAARIRQAMGTTVFASMMPTVRALKEREDGDMLLAVALKGFFAWNRQRLAAKVDLEDSGDAAVTESEPRSDDRGRDRDRDRKRGRGRRDEDDRRGGKGRKRDGDRKRDDDRKRRKDRKRYDEASDDLDALLEEAAPKAKKKTRNKKPEADVDDLDALLEEAAAPSEKKDKKPKRAKKKSKKKADDLDALLETDGGDDLDDFLSAD